MIVIAWGAATHAGQVRAQNQDALLAEPPIFVVADGMGGHAGGEVASQIAVETFRRLIGRVDLGSGDVAAALQQANTTILATAVADPELIDMGTTVVGLALIKDCGRDCWLAFNIGDSRIYRLHGGVLTQISVDHSYVQDLVDAGRLAPDEARTHPERNIVTRVLGLPEPSAADYWIFTPEAGERFLICSDGLSEELDDWTIRQLLLSSQNAEVVAHRLIEATNEAGGRDNVTAIVLDVGMSPDPV